MTDELVPLGSVLATIAWWNTPDKYAGPDCFETPDGGHFVLIPLTTHPMQV